jgi:hypothetical protein
MISICQVCGHVFDVMQGLGCPACRAYRVEKAFRPLDQLRNSFDAEGVRVHGQQREQDVTEAFFWHGPSYLSVTQHAASFASETEVPEGCWIPIDEQAQVYELQRMRKLIGRL